MTRYRTAMEKVMVDRSMTRQNLRECESRLTLALTVRIGGVLTASMGLAFAAIKALTLPD